MFLFFFFKQKTAYEMRISDWSSDVCSSDLTIYERLAEEGLLQTLIVCRDSFEDDSGAFTSPILRGVAQVRSEEHTSELQSLMRISYAVFCLKKKKRSKQNKWPST